MSHGHSYNKTHTHTLQNNALYKSLTYLLTYLLLTSRRVLLSSCSTASISCGLIEQQVVTHLNVTTLYIRYTACCITDPQISGVLTLQTI